MVWAKGAPHLLESTPAQQAQQTTRPNVSSALRTYPLDISILREVKGELRIVGPFEKVDLERLRKALDGLIAMIEVALKD